MLDSVVAIDELGRVHAGGSQWSPGDRSYDLATMKFDDDGKPGDQELAAVQTTIANARTNPNGAVVVLFIHGWHHNADWDRSDDSGDEHFKDFRAVLHGVMMREAERPGTGSVAGGRRLVGIYLGWNGKPNWWAADKAGLRHLSFRDRYAVAERIGGGQAFGDALRAIVASTKGPLTGVAGWSASTPESPLTLIGHSMGALMLESAFLSLLKAPDQPLVFPSTSSEPVAIVRQGRVRVSFPDVLIALNSAADSRIMHDIRSELAARQLTKTVNVAGIGYAPPMLMSATSESDTDTGILWPSVKPGRRTDGHDPSLFTHRLVMTATKCPCLKKPTKDFGQVWHCVRRPHEWTARPSIPIDLPDESPIRSDTRFNRYVLEALGDRHQPESTWVFQVPPSVIGDHNDVFNSTARELMLSLMQISGAVMSLARDWPDTFEPEPGPVSTV